MGASNVADGAGQIWLDSVVCSMFDTAITDCSISAFGGHSCNHSQDVGVICEGEGQ